MEHLLDEPDGLVRFRILRALGRLAADHPDAALDEAVLREATERTINAAIELLYWRINLVRGAAAQPKRLTPGHSLIVMLLRDKERHTVERIFRLLGLAFRHENLRSIHRGLANANPKVRAGSRELLENLLAPPLRESVLGLVDDVPDERRLAGLRPDLARTPIEYEALLTLLGERGRHTLSSIAGYHARELGLATDVRREVLESKETGVFASRVLEAAQVAVVGAAAGRPDIGFVVGVIVRLHETLLLALGLLVLSYQGMSLARLRAAARVGA